MSIVVLAVGVVGGIVYIFMEIGKLGAEPGQLPGDFKFCVHFSQDVLSFKGR